MSLTACRECGEQVSTEATACPHCGATSPTAPEAVPTPAPSPAKSGGYWFGIACAGVVVALVVAFIGYHVWQSQQGVEADGSGLEQQIVDTYSRIAPNATLHATCPSTVRLHKGKIVDCSVSRSDNGKDSPVFITPTDDSGHFQMQIEDTSLLFPSAP